MYDRLLAYVLLLVLTGVGSSKLYEANSFYETRFIAMHRARYK